MTRHLLRCAVLACIACHVVAFPLAFFTALVLILLGYAVALVGRDERLAARPAMKWARPVLNVERAAVTRRKGILS